MVFMQSSLVICLVAFQLLTVIEVREILANISLLGTIFNQILMLCAFGQKLINSSIGVSEGVYASEWESINDIRIKKSLLLILLKAQNPKKLTAMNFVDISLEIFTKVTQ
jgi:hypothetical protein